MLRLVDAAFQPSKAEPSLVEVSKHVRQAAEHLASAYDMLDQTSLEDRARLQFTLYAAVAKLAPVITQIAREVAAGHTRA
ncbi:hypothetical protein ACJ4V0_20660 [Phreatobacter sp. HK31-P]